MSCIMLQFQPGWAKDAVREEDIIKARKEEEEKQIDLLNMQHEEENNLDENVLEIPAFLRRQAN